MEYLDDKINCPYCNYPIPKDEVVCPVCDGILDNTESKVAKDKTDEEVVKASSSYLHTYSTDPKIIMLLTGMFCLGIWLFFLFIFIEYQPQTGRNPGLMSQRIFGSNNRFYSNIHRLSFRQTISLLLIILEESIVFGSPFMFLQFSRFRRKFFEWPKIPSIIFYSICMLAAMLFWWFYFGDFILTDLNDYYYNKFYSEDYHYALSVTYSDMFTLGDSSTAISLAETSAEQSATIKAMPYVNNTFLFYKITYFLSTLCLYVPYIIYYAFELDFDQDDANHYVPNFNFVYAILVALALVFYEYLTEGMVSIFIFIALAIYIFFLKFNPKLVSNVATVILAIVIIAVVIYTY